jgi:hypothetical protein
MKFNLIIVFIILLKLGLVSYNEIISLPYDSEGYILRSLSNTFDINYNNIGYPLWLIISSFTGIPQRLAVEFFYIFSLYYLVSSFSSIFNNIFICVIFAVLVFNPITYFLFDYALSDGFYMCLTLLAVAINIRIFKDILINDLKYQKYIFLGLIFGFMSISRIEDPIVFSWILINLLFYFYYNKKLFPLNNLFNSFKVFFSLLVSTFFIPILLCFIFYLNGDPFARNITIADEHTKLLVNLAKIDTGVSQSYHVPISYASRQLAYDVSPTFASLRAKIENLQNPLQIESQKVGLPPFEIGGGWIWWALIGAVNAQYSPSNASEREQIFKKINSELNLAYNEKKLKTRFIINPLVGGEPLNLLFKMPHNIFTVINRLHESILNAQDLLVDNSLFDLVTFRRISLVNQKSNYIIDGWVFVDDPLIKINKIDFENGKSGKTNVFHPRDDVSSGYKPILNYKPDVIGFHENLFNISPDNVNVTYYLSNGNIIHTTIRSIGIIDIVKLNNISIYQGIDYIKNSSSIHDFKFSIQKSIILLYNSITIKLLFLLIIIIYGMALLINKKFRSFGLINISIYLLLIIIVLRLLFYSIIQSASWNIEIRYLASTQTQYLFLVLLIFCQLASSSFQFFKLRKE